MIAHPIRRVIAPLAVATALLAGTAAAQQTQPPGMQPGMHRSAQGAQAMPMDPASRGYMQSMHKMNRDMRKPMAGDADQDFARMMAAHHRGAVDMARVELEHGKDPELKAMAQTMVDDQTREIQQLQDWLKQHPAKPAAK